MNELKLILARITTATQKYRLSKRRLTTSVLKVKHKPTSSEKSLFKMYAGRATEMARWSFVKDLGSVPSIQRIDHNHH